MGSWGAKYPGTLGNSIEVQVCSANNTAWAAFDHASLFDNAPGTSEYAQGLSSTGDEMHIVVIDSAGAWTGTPGTVLEKFSAVSQASDARKADGTTNYYADVINGSSAYIWFLSHDALLSNAGGDASGGVAYATATSVMGDGVNLTGGSDDNSPTDG